MKKTRLDQLMVSRGLAESRNKAQALIMAGEVRVNGAVQLRAALPIAEDAIIEVAAALPYVSRGGTKLAHALDAFGLDPQGRVALDAGASTGGFTDVLLQRGAARVYAVDVGYGILHWKIRQDPRVVVLERTNIRYLEALPVADGGPQTADDGPQTMDDGPQTMDDGPQIIGEGSQNTVQDDQPMVHQDDQPMVHRPSSIVNGPKRPSSIVQVDCAVIDVSFIPLELVLPAVRRLLVADGWVVALIKPQFEAGADQVGKGGVVRDPAVHRAVLRRVLAAAANMGLPPRGLVRSPITGPAGNVEFLAWLQGGDEGLDVERAIGEALS